MRITALSWNISNAYNTLITMVFKAPCNRFNTLKAGSQQEFMYYITESNTNHL